MITVECLVDKASVKAKNQGNRPTCLAFAVTDLNRSSADEDLGPEYFYRATLSRIPGWQPGDGLQIPAAIEASALGHPTEREFPYRDDEPEIPLEDLPEDLAMHGRPIEFFAADIGELIGSMQALIPVGLALRLTVEFYRPVDGIVPFSPTVLPGAMMHAVVAVGLGYDAHGEPWFLLRNTWGEGWGRDGHAWISASYIASHAACAFGVEHGSSDSR
ncbi:hypothetical protein DV532_24420 [Pseudomonas sp. Leaf58]|uniref:C1 family peptidase n=1 Tax=Pseudomonas sp. Leaf58 TaxID=1736226 RepID=UPI000A44F066|nr:C1 family peptidase [Pseudomonas sp. Leaf58]AYG47267.1 hypothetical protein DV532_24420 [Pseudomonas sp. Leaf58]